MAETDPPPGADFGSGDATDASNADALIDIDAASESVPMAAVGAGTVAALQAHTPSSAGSVLEIPNGFGGSLLIRIQNISCTADLGIRLDLKQIALRCRNTEFNPRRFAAVIMRLREPRATALIFASGRMVVTGTSSSHNASLASKKFAFIVERVGFRPQPLLNFKIQNLMGTADVGFPVRLEGVAYAHPTFSSYEPELFPGLIYRLVQNPRAVLLIFVSGKVVITGCKTERDLAEALKKVFPVLVEFRKVDAASFPGDEPVEGEAVETMTEGGAVATNEAPGPSAPAVAASDVAPPSVAASSRGVPRVAKAVASSSGRRGKGKRVRSS